MPRQARIDAPGAVHHLIIGKTRIMSYRFLAEELRWQSAGIDLSSMMGAVCRNLGVEEKEMACPSKQVKIARARALIAHMATQDLSISGSEVARRLNIDRSAGNRAVQRARHDAQLMADANSIWKLIKAPISQQ